MPDKVLSRPEVTALLVLMVVATEISNPELKENYGLTIDGATRRNLNELKLVESRREGRSYVHVLTDAGWARMAADMRAGITVYPAGTTYAAPRALLIGLRRFMARTDYRPADIFQPDPVAADDAAVEVDGAAEDIERLIRAAYAELAAEPGAWVSLARLRPLLGGAGRAEVDETLIRMIYLPEVNFVPESNQKTLTDHDREAAVIIGDQQKHLVSIGAR